MFIVCMSYNELTKNLIRKIYWVLNENSKWQKNTFKVVGKKYVYIYLKFILYPDVFKKMWMSINLMATKYLRYKK